WAEGAGLSREETRAAKLFESVRMATQSHKNHEHLQALLGLCRLKILEGGELQEKAAPEATTMLSRLHGPWPLAWRAALDFLGKDPATLSAEDYAAALRALRALQNPETRIEILRLLGRRVKKLGLHGLGQKIFEEMSQEWDDIYQHLPEE